MLLIFFGLGVFCFIGIVSSLAVESEIDWRPDSKEISNTGSRLRHFLFIIAVICFISIVVCGALVPIMIEVSTFEKITNSTEILNVQNKSNQEYIYFSVDTQGDYTYYYKLEDGGIEQKKAKPTETKIYEDEVCEKPLLLTYTTYEKEEMNEFFSNIIYFSTDNIKEKETGKRYEIHIPKGTIKY